MGWASNETVTARTYLTISDTMNLDKQKDRQADRQTDRLQEVGQSESELWVVKVSKRSQNLKTSFNLHSNAQGCGIHS